MRAAAAGLVSIVAGCIEPRTFTDHDAADGADGAAVDGGSIDAADAAIDAAFMLSNCDPLYTIEIGASRYRFRAAGTFFAHYGACLSDSPGYTHMAVVSDAAEAAALGADTRICNPAGNCDTFWTGVYAIDGTGFVSGTGETPFYVDWATGQPLDFDEAPTAITFSPANGQTADTSADLDIDPGTIRALCECDGRPAQALNLDDFN